MSDFVLALRLLFILFAAAATMYLFAVDPVMGALTAFVIMFSSSILTAASTLLRGIYEYVRK